jgi:hypothetical protein
MHTSRAAISIAEIEPIPNPVERPNLTVVPSSAEPKALYEIDPDSPDYSLRLIDPVARADLAEKMARKKQALQQSATRFREAQAERALKDSKVVGLAQLAGERALLTFIGGDEQDVFIAGMAEYSGRIRPDYNAVVNARKGIYPETIKNQLVYRLPDQMEEFHTISPDEIISFRPRTNEDMPLLWHGDNS